MNLDTTRRLAVALVFAVLTTGTGMFGATLGAKPGFFIELAGGINAVGGTQVGAADIHPMQDGTHFVLQGGMSLTTDFDTGPGLLLKLGYNILGYAAVELYIGGGGDNVGDASTRNGVGHVGLVVRGYPLHIFKPGFPVEPYLFFGGGYSIQGQNYLGNDIGWDGGVFVMGLGVEYYPVKWFSVGLELRYLRTYHRRFMLDWNDNLFFPVDPRAVTNFVLPSLAVGFHFQAAK